MPTDFLDLLTDLLARAKRAGADDADAVYFESASLSVAQRLGQSEKLERSESRDLGLRVLIGRQQAMVSSTDLETKALDELVERVRVIAEGCGASSLRISESEDERLAFWAGRKNAFPAVGRLSPDYYCMDGTIPRGKLARVLARMTELSSQYGLRVANVFHAGDGNLHPLILYDASVPGELERTEEMGAEILKLCVEVGGVLTGEHGVGIEKRDLMGEMFNEIDLAHQQRVKCAFDPDGLLNPGKVFPELHRCAELGKMHVHGGKLPFPDLPRF